MSSLVLGSAKASPGVTTAMLALAAVWPDDRRLLLVEADPDGGVLAPRCGLSPEPGLATLAVAGRRTLDEDVLTRHTQSLSVPDVTVLAGPPAAEQARRALDLCATSLAGVIEALPGTDALVDAGRFAPGTAASPLVAAADGVLLAARPRLEELQLLPARLRALRLIARRVGVLLIGERPYPHSEVAAALDTQVVGVLADDPRAAAALAGEGRGASLGRSPLLRSARDVVEAVRTWLPPPINEKPSAADGKDRLSPGSTGDRVDAEAAR